MVEINTARIRGAFSLTVSLVYPDRREAGTLLKGGRRSGRRLYVNTCIQRAHISLGPIKGEVENCLPCLPKSEKRSKRARRARFSQLRLFYCAQPPQGSALAKFEAIFTLTGSWEVVRLSRGHGRPLQLLIVLWIGDVYH